SPCCSSRTRSRRRFASATGFWCSRLIPAAPKRRSIARRATCAATTASCCRRESSACCSSTKEPEPMPELRPAAASRPEIVYALSPLPGGFEVAAATRSIWARLYANGALRKSALLVLLALAWELYARALATPLLFPTFSATVGALAKGLATGTIPRAGAYTLSLLLKGYVLGLAIALLLTALASVSRLGADLLETLTAMFNPLPSIALLPLALIWFGLG